MNNMQIAVPDKRNYRAEMIGSSLIVLPMTFIVYKIFSLANAPLTSIFHKIKNIIGRRIGVVRSQRIQDTVVEIQNYLRDSNKKTVCLIALDIFGFYVLMKARRGLINTLVMPMMLSINEKCFSNCISDDVIKNICNQDGYLDNIYIPTLVTVLDRVIARIKEIRAHRNLNAQLEALQDTDTLAENIDFMELTRGIELARNGGVDIRNMNLIRAIDQGIDLGREGEIGLIEEVQEFRQEVQIRELEDSEEEQEPRIQINRHLLN